MAGRYGFAGLSLSTDFGLPELEAANDDQIVDLTLIASTDSRGVATVVHRWEQDKGGVLSVARLGEQRLLQFDEDASFGFDRKTRIVTCPLSLSAAGRHQLLDHVLPRVLDHLGHLMVHGSAVATQRGVVMFVGDSGRGKSTLAASFHDAGVEVLSDDCLRLRVDMEVIGCIPTYRSLRLWPDSADAIMGEAESVPMAANADKRRIGLPSTPRSQAREIAAICVLGDPTDASSEITCAEVPPAWAVTALLSQCFRLDPTDQAATARVFDQCVDVVERVPVVELRYPRDYGRLPEVREAVLRRAEVDGWDDLTAT